MKMLVALICSAMSQGKAVYLFSDGEIKLLDTRHFSPKLTVGTVPKVSFKDAVLHTFERKECKKYDQVLYYYEELTES